MNWGSIKEILLVARMLAFLGQMSLSQWVVVGNTIGFIAMAQGYIYATLFYQHEIWRVHPGTGEAILFCGNGVGSADGDISEAQLNGPNGIVTSPDGSSLYVSEYYPERIRKITGLPTTIPVLMPTKDSDMVLSPNPGSGDKY